jgi:hypothetical protein
METTWNKMCVDGRVRIETAELKVDANMCYEVTPWATYSKSKQ